jgi:NAD+ kinase
MNFKFQHIEIIGRTHNDDVLETLKAVIKLLHSLNLDISLEKNTDSALDLTQYNTVEKSLLGQSSDLVIVVGGDGSLLSAARIAAQYDTPVLGINRGNLGFLSDIAPSELEDKLLNVLQGDYITEERFMLTATAAGNTHFALNEVALMAANTPHLICFDIYVDDKLVCNQRADGIIIATPTGSTAYALSGGGPILHPELNAIVLVPMFPHTLSMRPIVINADRKITLQVAENHKTQMQLSCDSQNSLPVADNSKIEIHKHHKALKLIQPTTHDYYESLRSKLHWAKKLAKQ